MKIIAWDELNDKAIIPERPPVGGEWAAFIETINIKKGDKVKEVIRITKKEYREPVVIDPDVIRVEQEKTWRDSELERTDLLSLLNDHPKKGLIIAYRAALRDYPANKDFPNGARPTQ